MWFGVAPSPAPSPSRANTQAWHPPHCTCARHSKTSVPEQQLQHQQHQHQQLHALSPRAHLTSPRNPLSNAKRGALQSANRDTQLQSAAASTGPMSPRAYRRQREQTASVAHNLQRQVRLDAYLDRAVPVSADNRAITPLWDSLDTVSSARPSTKTLSRHVADDEPVAVDDKQPQEDGALSSYSGKSNNFSFSRDGEDGNNSITDTLSDDMTVERRSLRSGRRVSRVTEFARSADQPPSGLVDPSNSHRLGPMDNSSQAPPVPPKSRRSSRTFPGFTLDAPEQNTSREHSAASFPSRIQPENLVGHASSVCSVVASDDRYLVSCSVDGSVKVWSRASFSCLHTLFGHEDNVSCIDINARWLVSGSHDATLRVYSCLEGFTLLHVLRGHTAHVTRVHLPPSLPQQILSCSDDSTIRVWSGDLGHCLFVLRDHASRITCFYAEGGRVCSGAADAAVCFWDLTAPLAGRQKDREIRATQAFRVHTATVQTLVANASVDGTLVLSGSNDGTIQIFNFQTLDYIGCLDHVYSPIYSMCLLSNSQLVCSTGDGRLLHFSDLYAHPLVRSELRLADKWISMLQTRGNTLVCSSEDLLFVVDTEQMRVHAVIETMHGFVNSVGWLHATALVSGGQDNVVKIWNIG